MERIEVDGGDIRYRFDGSGPSLVLLTTLSGTWMRQLPVLTRHFRVLTYDMRGFGESVSDTGFPANAEHADDLAVLFDRLDIDRAAVIGMSHGGLVAQHFAAKHSERLSGLGLVATFAAPHGPTSLLLRMLNGFLDRGDLAGFWEVLKSMLFSAAGAPALLRREKALRRAMFDQYDVDSLGSIYRQAIEHDSRTWLGDPGCPTLVVGGAEDILFPPVLTEELADLVPGARTELLPAAHIPPVEAFRPFNDLVVETFGRAS
ncbi:alpha/beta fold hydrolase [Amycolatopsis sp. EV170708-02-1]|uniref:alpha/beta fold hydrolase n=1 Tax=Amycolatopsis sp. EV170708-02-1 TaxID=2919322 RepID=UPI001F0B9ED0|nr:alpha/beta fold hydrolase [Amycolatopsis sp. EV170708-02-1]UMP00007.1 alpha/beta hydrolase [Amycolatopsis sp. EV170708-02-1]